MNIPAYSVLRFATAEQAKAFADSTGNKHTDGANPCEVILLNPLTVQKHTP